MMQTWMLKKRQLFFQVDGTNSDASQQNLSFFVLMMQTWTLNKENKTIFPSQWWWNKRECSTTKPFFWLDDADVEARFQDPSRSAQPSMLVSNGVGRRWSFSAVSACVHRAEGTLKRSGDPERWSNCLKCSAGNSCHHRSNYTAAKVEWAPDERPPWWETTLMRDRPVERPPWWKDCPYERPPRCEMICWETALMRDHPDERPPWWETILIRDHPDERPPWWETALMRHRRETLKRDHPDERPPWWETALMRDHPDQTLPWRETTLMRDRPDERPPWWLGTTLMRDHIPDERPPSWETILMKRLPWRETTLTRDYPDERLPWRETTLMRDHPNERPPWWETTLKRDHLEEY